MCCVGHILFLRIRFPFGEYNEDKLSLNLLFTFMDFNAIQSIKYPNNQFLTIDMIQK